ncbi:hypothetical protein [Lactobacillus johnsonii]|uniref:Uncharacterized protein n=1 Tax=Lactobacillus johnsonii TaxID=33959 RepID=A0A9X6NZE9_LACJH|nr:hypothetical protein [Lactobacillus johnsonii]OYS04932.1 hypothetical protein CBF54_02715 [Lactobacillus johnsonii]OYS08119.1 hypothetical protein CBF63_06775 [Lactobacillus johnsonii]OYS09318.1 hypothetical protein CBF62_00895 [Lactobacillus johnsonii]OYS09879.1 hypothetical protein CBF65_03740 [Lactobacillus johnsonii]OYS09888.1 hypothetical protein CBF65_03790 [Lactobacillus johnsonii]
MNRNAEQFVRFNYIGSLNEWLQNYSHLVLIKDYQVINIKNELVYIIRFSLKPEADKLARKDKDPVSYKEQFEILINEANKLN